MAQTPHTTLVPNVDLGSTDHLEGQMTRSREAMKRDILETRDVLPVIVSPWFDIVVEGQAGPSAGARRRKRLEEQAGVAGEDSRPVCIQGGFTACRIVGRETEWEVSQESNGKHYRRGILQLTQVRSVHSQCLDLLSSLDSCGGCPGTPASIDCTELEGVADVACDRGTCRGESHAVGFPPNPSLTTT